MSIEPIISKQETANEKRQKSALVKMMLGRQQVTLEPERKERRTDDKNRYSRFLNENDKTSISDLSQIFEGGHGHSHGHGHDEDENQKAAVA